MFACHTLPMSQETPPAVSLRRRVRGEMVDEIKRAARRHIAAHGVANLSLRAVARELGMVSSAIYRYFASRDELLAVLVDDLNTAMAEAVRQAEAAVDRASLADRLVAFAHAVRNWALANPHEYALVCGRLPGETEPAVVPASRAMATFAQIIVDGSEAGVLRPQPGDWLGQQVNVDMLRLADRIAPGVPPAVMARAMVAWTLLHGAIGLELSGHLAGLVQDVNAWFDHEVHTMARLIGLRP